MVNPVAAANRRPRRKKAVTIGLEALNRFECYLVNTMDDLCRHLEEINHPNITAMYDTFHANIEEADPIGALLRNKGHVTHIHISENDRGVPGRGNIPWKETFAAIAETGYDDWLTIESFGRGLPDLAAATKVWRDFAESTGSSLSGRIYSYPQVHESSGAVTADLEISDNHLTSGALHLTKAFFPIREPVVLEGAAQLPVIWLFVTMTRTEK